MRRLLTSPTAWLRRHAFPVTAATVIAVGVAGGAVTYAVAGHPGGAGATANATPSAATPTPSGRPGPAAARHAATAQVIALLTRDTGQSLASIRTQLQTGRSLNEIAGAADAARFEGDVLAAVRSRLDRSVAAATMTGAQESSALARAKSVIERLMAEPGTSLLQQLQRLGQLGKGTHGAGRAAPANSSAA